MPSGKLAAQVAHASVKVFLDIGNWGSSTDHKTMQQKSCMVIEPASEAMEYWMRESFPKAVLGIDSEMDIEILYAEAQRAGLPCSKVIDTGRTVYNGEHNLTCIAIGPAERSEIDKITGHLPLYKDMV
jgi:peptidyl-tRNA hydrolase